MSSGRTLGDERYGGVHVRNPLPRGRFLPEPPDQLRGHLVPDSVPSAVFTVPPFADANWSYLLLVLRGGAGPEAPRRVPRLSPYP